MRLTAVDAGRLLTNAGFRSAQPGTLRASIRIRTISFEHSIALRHHQPQSQLAIALSLRSLFVAVSLVPRDPSEWCLHPSDRLGEVQSAFDLLERHAIQRQIEHDLTNIEWTRPPSNQHRPREHSRYE